MSLSWVSTTGSALDYGLNFYGPTIINSLGAVAWAQSMRGWAQVFASGPETLRLYSGVVYNPHEKEESDDTPYDHFLLVNRDAFVANLLLLAEWGDKAATGEYFILHLGI